MEWLFELWHGAYIVHTVYAQELASGDTACNIELKVAGQVRCLWQVLILPDGSWRAFEMWSDEDALNWWYGYVSEASMVETIKAQLRQ